MLARTQSDVATLTSPEARAAGVKRALLIVLLLNAISASLKVGVGARTGSLTVLGAALESGLDLYNDPEVMTTGVLSYTGVALKKGEQRLTFEVTGSNPEAVKAFMVAVDYIRLVPSKSSSAPSP